jgi:hypothetical protein
VDFGKILGELRTERDQLEEAILSLERLAVGGAERRGRPPAWMAQAKSAAAQPKRRGRPAGSKNRNVGEQSAAA